MYLVLTALLVLNVSAEVINAFCDLDKSFKKSMLIANEAPISSQNLGAKYNSQSARLVNQVKLGGLYDFEDI